MDTQDSGPRCLETVRVIIHVDELAFTKEDVKLRVRPIQFVSTVDKVGITRREPQYVLVQTGDKIMLPLSEKLKFGVVAEVVAVYEHVKPLTIFLRPTPWCLSDALDHLMPENGWFSHSREHALHIA